MNKSSFFSALFMAAQFLFNVVAAQPEIFLRVAPLMLVSEVKNVTITYKNNSATTWLPGAIFLRQISPSTIWFEGSDSGAIATSQNHVQLPAPVPPGSVATFAFRVKAPAATGHYNLGWQLYDSAGPVLNTDTSRAIVVVTLEDVTPPGKPPAIDPRPFPLHPPHFGIPAQGASNQRDALLDEPPGYNDPHPNAGKVVRRKIADISPAEDREYARQKLIEATEAISGPKASPLCNGFGVSCRVNVDASYVGHLRANVAAVKSLATVGKFGVKFADLTNSDFRKFTLLGYTGGNFGQPPPWSSVARLFKGPNEDLIYLTEWDFVSTGGSIEESIEFLNAKIGNFDASVGLSIANNGGRLWQATWADLPRRVQLYYACTSANCLSQAEFLALANSIYAGK